MDLFFLLSNGGIGTFASTAQPRESAGSSSTWIQSTLGRISKRLARRQDLGWQTSKQACGGQLLGF